MYPVRLFNGYKRSSQRRRNAQFIHFAQQRHRFSNAPLSKCSTSCSALRRMVRHDQSIPRQICFFRKNRKSDNYPDTASSNALSSQLGVKSSAVVSFPALKNEGNKRLSELLLISGFLPSQIARIADAVLQG